MPAPPPPFSLWGKCCKSDVIRPSEYLTCTERPWHIKLQYLRERQIYWCTRYVRNRQADFVKRHFLQEGITYKGKKNCILASFCYKFIWVELKHFLIKWLLFLNIGKWINKYNLEILEFATEMVSRETVNWHFEALL